MVQSSLNSTAPAKNTKRVTADPTEVVAVEGPQNLGIIQRDLEAATRSLRSAQDAFTKAQVALATAEEKHKGATIRLNKVVKDVLESSRVASLLEAA